MKTGRKVIDLKPSDVCELDQIFNSVADAICVITSDFKVLRVNTTFEKLFKRSHSEVAGKACFGVCPSPLCHTPDCPLARLRNGDERIIYETAVNSSDGRKILCEVTVTPLREACGAGEAIGVIQNIRDITAHKEAEKQVHLYRSQLFQASKMASLGTLMSGEAHDLNNLLTFTLLNATILEKINEALIPILDEYSLENGDFPVGGLNYSEVRDRVSVLFSDVLQGLKQIRHITENIKRFARREPSELPTKLDINSIVSGAVRIVSGLIQRSCDDFKVDYAETLPEVMGMPQRIGQVVINLLLNACQSLTGNHQSISVSTGIDRASQRVLIKVRDEGAGMPEDVLKRVREPFFTTKYDTGGSGLGLAIADRIVQDHGGALEFDSSPGLGTTVTVSLPIATE